MNTAHALIQRLATLAPVFNAKAEQIKFLTSPTQFYEYIIQSIGTAQRRVSLASLYLGTEDLERHLIAVLKDKLSTENGSKFKAHVHLDYLRGTRGPFSSAHLLRPSICPSLLVTMYRTQHLSGWRRLMPPRWNEIFGLSHMKVCVFDDTVVMTGANLSKNYFKDRVDRYVCIEGHPKLAAYFCELLDVVGNFSHRLLPGDIDPSFSEPVLSMSDAEATIQSFLSEQLRQSEHSNCGSTAIIPTLQMAPHNIRQDEKVLEEVVDWTNLNQSNAAMALATGYFNLAPLAQHILSRADQIGVPWKILTSSPQANGFFESAGMSKYIPDTYRAIELDFLKDDRRPKLVKNEKGEEGLFEFIKDCWTFHAKGLWIDSPDLTTTIIGSSNFGHRSFDRDLEAQLTIITEDLELRAKILSDRDELFKYGKLVTASDIETDQRPSYSVKTAASLFKSYL
jgi:CDP-diacylglycerol--glycerol-3-phosphate 3-phosphatidyltransferase